MTALRQATMSALNESLVLDYVRDHDGTSRSAMSRDLGLSAASVSRITARLLRSEMVTESSSAAEGRGRPAGRLHLNERAGCVMAIDLGGTKCHGALADLSGAILIEDVRPTAQDGTPYETLTASIKHLAAAATTPLVAAAIGVPAIIDPDTGVVLGGPNVHWRDFAIVDELKDTLDVPFLVDNDVKLAAMAQAWRGHGRGLSDFVTLSLGTGVGGAVVANGELVRGRNNAAGELGYLITSPSQLREPHADELGGVERIISGPGIAARARELLAVDASDSELDIESVSSRDVLTAALTGDRVAMLVVEEVLDGLAMALIAMTATADPELIIIDGGVGRSLEPYLDRISASMARHIPWQPRLAVSQLGPVPTVLGAIATALWLDRQQVTPQIQSRHPKPPPVTAHVS
jgi:glucokinase